MNRLVTFAPVAMLAIFNTYAQQSTAAYIFKSLVATGSNIGGHTFTQNTAIDGVALNDAGDIALVVSQAGGEHTAVYTRNRLIASSGDIIDGKTLTRIIATSISINTAGAVAYEADYGNNPSQTGIFVERKFKLALSQSGSPNDFALQDNGDIVLRAAVAAPVTPNPSSPAQTTRSVIQELGGLRLPPSVAGQISHSPFPNLGPGVFTRPKPPQRPTARAAVPQTRPCPVPQYPYPVAWAVGDEMIGPVTSHIVEEPPKAKPYQSRFFGHVATPLRVVEYNAECKPILIALLDSTQEEHFEMHSPIGVLTYTKPDGFLALPGFIGNVLPDLVVRSDTPLRVNRHGQVLMPVVEPGGYAILLATPIGGPR